MDRRERELLIEMVVDEYLSHAVRLNRRELVAGLLLRWEGQARQRDEE